MVNVLTPVAVANMALAKIGAAPIQSFDQSLPPGPAVALLYQEVIGGLLSEVPWSFTRQMLALTPLAETSPDGSQFLLEGYQYAYQAPPNLLANPVLYLADPRMADRPYKDIQVIGQAIYANRSPLWALCQARADESVWPPYFVTAAVACLAAELVMPISGNSGLLAAKQEEAWGTPEEKRLGGKLGQAKLADSRSQGSRVLSGNPMIDCRA